MKKTIANTTGALPDPDEDGKSHINVHFNHAATKLGKMLSTYFVASFEHPYFGPFRCVEGLMLYIKTGCMEDRFRKLTGARAKALYRDLIDSKQLTNRHVEKYDEIQKLATWAKLVHNPEIMDLFKAAELPFDSYYLFGAGNVPIRPPDGVIMVNNLNQLRELVKAGKVPTPLPDEQYEALRIK
jgi:hypothetical protein